MTNKDYSNQTLTNFQGEYFNRRFVNVTLQGQIDVKLNNCIVRGLTFKNFEVVRFETSNTTLQDVNIVKPTIQPIHWAKTVFFFKHNHSFCASRLRDYARWLHQEHPQRRRLYDAINQSAKTIEHELGSSWNDFLLTEPREVWALAEDFFSDIPEVLNHALVVRDKRWPELRDERVRRKVIGL